MYWGVPATTPALRQAGVVDRAGEAEIGDLDPLDAVLQQDVRGLDVAMDQPWAWAAARPEAVCMPIRRISRTCIGPVRSIRSWSDVPGTSGMTRYGEPPDLVDGVDGDDVVVANGRGRLRLAGERRRAAALVASCGASTLIATNRLRAGSSALEDQPHPAPADDLDHLVGPEPAECRGVVRGGEEVEPGGRLARLRAGPLRAERRSEAVPPRSVGGERLQRPAARLAAVEVPDRPCLLVLGEGVGEEAGQPLGVATCSAGSITCPPDAPLTRRPSARPRPARPRDAASP